MNIYTHQDSNIRKTWLLMGGFLVVVIAIGFVFSELYGDPFILYIAVGLAVITNVVSYWQSDKIALSISKAVPADPSQFLELHRMVENFAITAGLPKPRVYIINDPSPNAFATGRNPEHSAIAVTTGLLQILEKNELEGVLAHEMSHIGNRDILISTVAVVLAGFIAIIADFFLRSRIHRGGNDRGGGALIIIGLVMAILAPIAATLMRLAISRKREFLADASGALLTRYPEGLASALEKIGGHGRPLGSANHATAHLFIANPFGGNGKSIGSFLTKLFMTHPPIEERVRALRGSDRA